MQWQLEQLTALYRPLHDVVTLYLRLTPDAGDTGPEDQQRRWRALRARLVDHGTTEAALAPVDERVARLALGDRVLAAFAADGSLRLAAELPGCDVADAGWFGPLPQGAPLVRWLQERLPYVLAQVDRAGGELTAVDASGELVSTEAVLGPDDEIERNAPGGWAQPRYQHRAEDSWAHNAGAVADRLAALAGEVGAGVVLVSGDVRAVQLLLDALPQPVRRLVQQVPADGPQPPQGVAGVAAETVRAAVAAAAERRRADLLGRLGEARYAASGAPATVEALQRAAVRTLFVVADGVDDRLAWVGAQPTQVSLTAPEVPDEAGTARVTLVDAVLRAALCTGADVVVLRPGEADLADGLAAELRY